MRLRLRVFLTLIAFHMAAYGFSVAAEDPPAEAPQPKKDGSLSEKLDKSKGVIKPPSEVDPRMVKPAPKMSPKSTPIIPPPAPEAK
jgi:hypothetical protein